MLLTESLNFSPDDKGSRLVAKSGKTTERLIRMSRVDSFLTSVRSGTDCSDTRTADGASGSVRSVEHICAKHGTRAMPRNTTTLNSKPRASVFIHPLGYKQAVKGCSKRSLLWGGHSDPSRPSISENATIEVVHAKGIPKTQGIQSGSFSRRCMSQYATEGTGCAMGSSDVREWHST